MKELITTIGLPYSGKSTLAKEYEKKGYEVIERDALLEEVLESQDFKDEVEKAPDKNTHPKEHFEFRQELATKLVNQKLLQEIESRGDKIFYDATNLQKATRAGVLALKEKGFKVSAIFLQVPIEEILKRAMKAERSGLHKTAIDAIPIMLRITEDIEESEGFDSIKVIEWKAENQELNQEFKAK